MCKDCGCGQGGEVRIDGQMAAEGHHHFHGTEPAHHQHHHADHPGHDHSHAPDEADAPDRRTLAVHQSLLDKNDRLAERNRGYFQAKGLLTLNLLSSPGSGKTTLVQKTAEALRGILRLGVIVGDLATDNDAARLRQAGIPVAQITTGTVCHLEAEMVARALARLKVDELDLLVIENVGNLVCPASYDLGEHLRVVLLSVTEGEDKPLKYPPIFHSAQAAIVTKTDLAAPCAFDRQRALENLRRVSHHARIFELSARTGEGLDAWCGFLQEQKRKLAGRP